MAAVPERIAWAVDLVGREGPETLLEVGCGNGVAMALVCERSDTARVTGLDRSATGTGLSARMAVLHARGLMKTGDGMTHASAIGSTFEGRIVEETRVGELHAIVPAIRGSAWITGIWQVLVDPTDPYPEGYLLSDTWGVSGLDTQT